MTDLKAQVEAAVMARGGKLRGQEIVFPCPNSSTHKHGDATPSANYNPSKAVWICRVCGESGNYWHLGRLLGVINDGHRPDGWQETRRWTIGPATHKRLEKAGERKRVIWEKDGKETLDGLPTADLPLYGLEHLTPDATDILLNEGEKKTDALVSLGFTALGTVTGAAGTPSVETLRPLAEHKGRVFLCCDNDQAGRDHMARIAARLKRMGKVAHLVNWPDVPEKGDAYDFVAAGHTAEDIKSVLEKASLCQGEAEPEPKLGLPEICVTGRPLEDKTADALAAIIASNTPPRIFRHGGGLARVETTEIGQPIIRPLSESAVRGELARAATWCTVTDKGTTPAPPPLDVVRDFLTMPGGWPGIPAIQSITENPVIRPGGSILDAEGYDPDTRLYYSPAPNTQIPPIPDRPSHEDIDSATTLLLEVFCDFPFDRDTSRANVLAALITPVVRPLITGPTPLCVIDKPQVGSGASLIATVIATITTGRPAAMMTAPRDPDEWRKTITSALMQGRSVVVIDNIEGQLYDSNLAAVLTATTYAARILGTMEIKDVPNLATWIATGNNIRLGGDLPRRAYLVRIDPGVARPWLRDPNAFRHPELETWCAGNRGRILAATLILARAWIVAGRPKPSEMPRLGGYESWVRVVSGILAHAGISGFLGNLMELYDRNDAETPAWAAFTEAWYEIFQDKQVTSAQILEELSNNKDFEAMLPIDPPRRDKKSGELDDSGFTRKLGKALAARDGRIYPGDDAEYKLVRGGTLRRAQLWQVTQKCELQGANSHDSKAKCEFGEFQSTPNAGGVVCAHVQESVGGLGQNSHNSQIVANSLVETKLTQDTPGEPPDYTAALGMSVDEAVAFWVCKGRPMVHLGPSVNCLDLELLLSKPDVPEEHLEAVKAWLQEHKGGELC